MGNICNSVNNKKKERRNRDLTELEKVAELVCGAKLGFELRRSDCRVLF